MYDLLQKADILTDIGKATEAVEILREIENAADAEFLDREGAKIAELFGAAFAILGDAEKAAAAYLDAAQKDKILRVQRGHISSYLFILHYLPNINTDDLYKELLNFESLFADTEKFAPVKYNHSKIKVGYLLPTSIKSSLLNFVLPLFTKFNSDEFEVYVYTFSDKSDEFTLKIKTSVDFFKLIDISSYYDATKTIREDEIDILFDLTGHGAGGDTLSILAYHPAPVQIVGIGWPSVCNLSFVDYVLTDDFLLDYKMQDKPLILNNALCFVPDNEMIKLPQKVKSQDSPISFGVFNNFMKITDEAIALWKEILESVPGSTLTLQDTTIYGERIDFMKNRLEKLGLTENVTIKIASENYLEDILDMDIILDTFPYTGGFMTATALTLGRPVVTLKGERFSQKFSADIINSTGIKELIAYNKEEYKDVAVKLAAIVKTVAGFNDIMRQRVLKSELLDATFYIKHLEKAYKRICK